MDFQLGAARRRARPAALAVVLVAMPWVAAACGSATPKAAPPVTTSPTTTSTSTTSTSTTTTSTTVPEALVSGVLTVLSPIGLNVRAGPSKSAAVLGSADQGTLLQLFGRTTAGGGWYKVEGATVTGWVSANPAYTAAGRFSTYNSAPFSVLYPADWVASGAPATGVTFRAPSGKEKVVITTATSPAKLPTVKQGAGVSQASDQQVVACGVTGRLFSYSTATPGRYLADMALPLATHKALGLEATLTSLAQVRTVLDFVNSLSFPIVVCVGRPPSPPTSQHKSKAAAAHTATSA